MQERVTENSAIFIGCTEIPPRNERIKWRLKTNEEEERGNKNEKNCSTIDPTIFPIIGLVPCT
jgi:hypothetical protein